MMNGKPTALRQEQFLSHEFKTPVANILSALELLRLKCDEQEAGKFGRSLDNIEKNACRLLRLAENICLLEAQREEPPTLAPTDVTALLRHVLHLCEPTFAAHGVTVTAKSEEIVTNASPELLERALLNLLSNAIHAMPTGGDITVSLCREGQSARLTVRDTGCGMSAAALRELLENERNSYLHGYGMQIIKLCAAAHGGTLCGESKEGEGSMFSFTVGTLCGEEAVNDVFLREEDVLSVCQSPFYL